MLRFILAVIVMVLSATAVHAAAVCDVTVGGLDFGNVDTIGNAQASTSADVDISCSGITPGTETITMCGNIGAGSGGATGGVRQAIGGGGTLGFALSTPGGAPWGSTAVPDLGSPYEIDVPVSGNSASLTLHLQGTVPAGQAAALPGDYSADLTTGDVDFKYAEGSLNCSSPSGADDVSAHFSVTASVPANCLLQTHDLDFGTTGLIGHNIDADTSMSITCTPGTDYSISIDGGGSGDPDHRLMSAGQNTISYGLYKDPTHGDNWGTGTEGTATVAGDGALHHETLYGRIPPQAAAPGSYEDTVVVTITY